MVMQTSLRTASLSYLMCSTITMCGPLKAKHPWQDPAPPNTGQHVAEAALTWQESNPRHRHQDCVDVDPVPSCCFFCFIPLTPFFCIRSISNLTRCL